MSTQLTRLAVWETAIHQSAIDCNCPPAWFGATGHLACVSKPTEGARAYLELPHICNLVSYGSNVVVTGQEDLLEDVLDCIRHVDYPGHCFETPMIYKLNQIFARVDASIFYMAEYFLPDPEAVLAAECPTHYQLRLLRQEDLQDLYLPQWSNALCAARRHLDVLAVGAWDGNTMIGLAGCSADCSTMWQIGVDVLPAYRQQGVAAAVTNRLAREILDRGIVPFYCAAWANLPSVKNALRAGFFPAWTEATAKPNAMVRECNTPEPYEGEAQDGREGEAKAPPEGTSPASENPGNDPKTSPVPDQSPS